MAKGLELSGAADKRGTRLIATYMNSSFFALKEAGVERRGSRGPVHVPRPSPALVFLTLRFEVSSINQAYIVTLDTL